MSFDTVDKKPIVAICYDFDKTLSPRDMQEFGLVDRLECSAEEFWKASGGMAKKEGMDKILAYMWLIIRLSEKEGIKITQEDFNKIGKTIELYPGVKSWFKRIDAIGKKLGVAVEHYIISAGLKEIIEGSEIASEVKGIYASSFLYDQYGRPVWPRQVVNYTTKTQYLYRISKNCLDLGDEDAINEYIKEEDRHIPLSNFIYIGDSDTDIPAMKLVKQGGGLSIAVFNPHGHPDTAMRLMLQQRIDAFAKADYSAGSELEKIVVTALDRVALDTPHA